MRDDTGFDELIHPATRLSIVALLAAADWADFTFIRDELDLSDSRSWRNSSRRGRCATAAAASAPA